MAREGAFDIDRVQRIDLKVSPFFAVLCDPPEQKRRPKTAIDAKFSIPFTVALALAQGNVGLNDFSQERLSDPKLHALADKVHHTVEPAWTFDQSTRGAMTLWFENEHSASREVRYPLGHPTNPMDESATIRKFEDCLACTRHPLDPAGVRRLASELNAIDMAADMRDLFTECR